MHIRYVGTHVWEHNNPCAQPDFNGTSLKSTRGLPMLNDATCFKQIFIVCGFTDLRSGIDTLASIVSEKTELGPFLPDTLFLFCGRKSDRIKGLVWEQDGFLLLYKRLEQGKFVWPRGEEDVYIRKALQRVSGIGIMTNSGIYKRSIKQS